MGASTGRRAGRPRGAPPNREAILAAARELFAEAGYERATIRAIAARAGVDPALVHHYFGAKDRLMAAAFELPFSPRDIVAGLGQIPPDQVGTALARIVVGALGGHPAAPGVMVGMLRAAASSEPAARMLREFITSEVLGPLAARLGSDRPLLRASLAGSQVVGLVMARHVARLPALTELSDDEVVAIYGPTLQRYLTGPLPTRAGTG